MRLNTILSAAVALAVVFGTHEGLAQRHFGFAYDQPRTPGFGVAADIFGTFLGRSSNGQIISGARLALEPQVLQRRRTGGGPVAAERAVPEPVGCFKAPRGTGYICS